MLQAVETTGCDEVIPVPGTTDRACLDSAVEAIEMARQFVRPTGQATPVPSYDQNLWIGHSFEGAAYLPR